MKKVLIAIGVLLALVGVGLSLWFFVLNKDTPAESYRKSIEATLKRSGDKGYLSFDASSEKTSFKGEAHGDLSGDEGSTNSTITASTVEDGIPFEYNMDLLTFSYGENNEEGYTKINSITTPSAEYKQNVEDYYSPVVNKWQKIPDNDEEDLPTSFAEDGPFSAVVISAVFMPVAGLSESDETKYLELIDKYNLFTVGETIEETTFRGIDARKLSVSVNKETLSEFENEALSSLSEESDFEKFSDQFLNDMFGDNDTLTAEVYLSADVDEIIGVVMEIQLAKAITETTFNTSMKKINSSILFDSSRSLNIEPPKEFLSAEEYSALLSGQ